MEQIRVKSFHKSTESLYMYSEKKKLDWEKNTRTQEKSVGEKIK